MASAVLPRGMFEFELGARIRGHPLVTSDIRAFDTFLSSMKHHQVLCHACCLSVLSARCPRHISEGTPSKPVIRSSLVKNGLKIVDKNIVVNFACVVFPDVPQQIWLIRMKLPLWINLCRVEERSVRLAYETKMFTDWQKTLGI